jgi:hypothetical protein
MIGPATDALSDPRRLSELITDPPDPPCYPLFSRPGILESQSLGPDRFLPLARDPRGRFAKGSSGNPGGRPRGIPNPKRRVPDLGARRLSPQALSSLLDRKPHLLRLLATQLLPPPLPPSDPAERLGIDLSSMRSAEHVLQALCTAFAAVSRGEIAPAEAALIARRVRSRLRALRRFARLERRFR